MTIQKFLLVVLIVALIVITNVDQVTAKKNGPKTKGKTKGSGSGSSSASSIINVTGSGVDVKAAAEQICNSSLTADQIKSIARTAENTEQEFNKKIKSAKDKDSVNLLKCQKLKNKILKNVCQLVAGQLAKKNDQIKLNTKQVGNNLKSHDTLCGKVKGGGTGVGSELPSSTQSSSGKGKPKGGKPKGKNK